MNLIFYSIDPDEIKEPPKATNGVAITETHPSLWEKKKSDMHDTEGWKSLETSMRLLQHMIQALGTDFLVFDFSDVIEILLKAASHLNRFVREITYFVIEELYKISEK